MTYSEGVKRTLSPVAVVFIAFGFVVTACSSSSNIEVVSQDTAVANTDTTDSPDSSSVESNTD